MQTNKALTPQQNDALRGVLRKIVDDDFNGVKLHAAKALGVSNSIVNEMLSGQRGAGTKVLAAISKYTRRSIDDLMGNEVRVVREHHGEREGDELGHHPDWSEREREFRAKMAKRGRQVDEELLGETKSASFNRALPKISVEFIALLYDALERAREDAEGS